MIDEKKWWHRGSLKNPVAQLDVYWNVIEVFYSVSEAANNIEFAHRGSIYSCCVWKRKTAWGFKWKYI